MSRAWEPASRSSSRQGCHWTWARSGASACSASRPAGTTSGCGCTRSQRLARKTKRPGLVFVIVVLGFEVVGVIDMGIGEIGVLIRDLVRRTAKLTLQRREIRGYRPVLQFSGDFRLLRLRTAAPHGASPLACDRSRSGRGTLFSVRALKVTGAQPIHQP